MSFLPLFMVALHSDFLALHRLLEGGVPHLGLSLSCPPCFTTDTEMPLNPLVLSIILRLLDVQHLLLRDHLTPVGLPAAIVAADLRPSWLHL